MARIIFTQDLRYDITNLTVRWDSISNSWILSNDIVLNTSTLYSNPEYFNIPSVKQYIQDGIMILGSGTISRVEQLIGEKNG
jgi:hypothetical protein